MKKLTILLISFVITFAACNNDKSPKQPIGDTKDTTIAIADPNAPFASKINVNITAKPTSFDDKMAYMQGLQLGNQINMMEMNPNIDFLLLGIKHGAEENKTYMTTAELSAMQQEVMKQGQEKMQEVIKKKQTEFEEAGKKAKTEGESFLAKNKTAEGIKTTASGLQYQIITAGDGKKATNGDLLLVHMKGSTIDGTDLEDTFAGDPMQMVFDKGMLPAWREAISLIATGGRIKIWSPAKLAFGDKGIFPNVPPNAVMHFEIQLVENQGKKAQQKAPAGVN